MIDRAHVLETLFGQRKRLWQRETRHEAMLLMKAVYANDAGARDKIVTAILEGPPQELLTGEVEHEAERESFEMLSFLESSEHITLPPEAREKLLTLREQHPEWRPGPYPGLSIWIDSSMGRKNVGVGDVKSIKPTDVPERIVDFQDSWEISRREFCEAIGVAISREPNWGVQVLDTVAVKIAALPPDATNPILWGIRATLTDNSTKLGKEHVIGLLNRLDCMIESRPDPNMWSSLPSLMRPLISRYNLTVADWKDLGFRLASIFEAFDYERSDETVPVEWHHRAINHPFGELSELFLQLAQQHVNSLLGAEKPLSLEPHAEKFFRQVLAHYESGSRYGLCILAQAMRWLEAISPEFAALLFNVFDWAPGGERPLVAWSGYLWSNTLSPRLTESFETTYVLAGRRHAEFANQERRGLANHVSAAFWFHLKRVSLLYQFASLVDSELRVYLLRGWKSHLDKAEEKSAKKFIESVILPYWDWCQHQDFFRGDTADRERLGFWELVPFSFESFPEASRRAIQRRPSKIDSLGLFVRQAVNDSTLRYPDELTELLIAGLECDPHPEWQDDEWRSNWHALKNTGAKRLIEFKNALAKKGISLEG